MSHLLLKKTKTKREFNAAVLRDIRLRISTPNVCAFVLSAATDRRVICAEHKKSRHRILILFTKSPVESIMPGYYLLAAEATARENNI